MEKILTISDRKIYNSYLTTGLPTSILLSQPHLYGYYLENYMQTLSCLDIYEDLDFAISDALDYTHPETTNSSVIAIEYKNADFISQLAEETSIKNF